MSNVYFMSDLHLFHKNICKFRPKFQTVKEHDLHIQSNILECSSKRNTLYLLGDTFLVNTEEEAKEALDIIKCWDQYFDKVYYSLGNHCVDRPIRWELSKNLPNVFGLIKYKEFWLSHAPIHPLELRGKHNIHGHVHSSSIIDQYYGGLDPNYINVCCENVGYKPIELKEIREQLLNA